MMITTETFTGITGILRPFKEYLQSLHLQPGDQVVYYGCVGTCTPFVELLAIAVRGMHLEQVYVPLLDEAKARKLYEVADAGMQVSSEPAVFAMTKGVTPYTALVGSARRLRIWMAACRKRGRERTHPGTLRPRSASNGSVPANGVSAIASIGDPVHGDGEPGRK